jgi:hypothetical protein
MKSVWNEPDRRELLERVGRLQPDAPARWGSFTAPQMLAHVSDCFRMAFGDFSCAPRRLPIRYPPLKQLIIYWLPFPKGAPTAPELVGRLPASWPGEVANLRGLIERFGREPHSRTWPDHPAFGSMTARSWGVLMYRHLDHHLRQFGA